MHTMRCACDIGFLGDDCSRVSQPSVHHCPASCSGHGRCAPDGVCSCFAGFSGAACDSLATDSLAADGVGAEPALPTSSSTIASGGGGNGSGGGSSSSSDSNSSSSDSSSGSNSGGGANPAAATVLPCPAGCSGHGWCEATGVCRCDHGFGGVACDSVVPNLQACASNCSGHGTCSHSRCECHELLHFRWGGPSCATLVPPEGCPNGCSGQGTCKMIRPGKGLCVCRHGFASSDCSKALACPARCNGRGDCIGGRCECERGWKGTACEAPRCAGDCSGHGECLAGSGPQGDALWSGNIRMGTGKGSLGSCLCSAGWGGLACDLWKPHCPNDCGIHGTCEAGRCRCEPGFVGEACAERRGAAPSASLALALGEDSCGATLCNGHGSCQRGRAPNTVLCACHDGYGGPRCGTVGRPRGGL